MLDWLERLRDPGDGPVDAAQWLTVGMVAVIFVALSTLIVAFDSFLPRETEIALLQVGDIAPADVRAPFDWRYESQVLTDRRRQEAMEAIGQRYDPPNPTVARQQIQLARQVLDYIDNIRRDPYGTLPQKTQDIEQITALTMPPEQVEYLLGITDEAWRAIDGEIINVLERMMREEIREMDLTLLRDQLVMQVSVRFSDSDASIVTAVVDDLLRPNTFPNPNTTEIARQSAADNTASESRIFERGQIVVREGARIEAVDFEALAQLGLLQGEDRHLQHILRALLASILVMIMSGLYISRFKPELLEDLRILGLIAALFLIVLTGARFFGLDSQLYIYPTAALALLLVSLVGAEIAIIGTLGLAILVGLMMNTSLEVAALVLVGGVMGTLTLRNAERLNTYFICGIIISLANILVVTLFNLEVLALNEGPSLGLLLLYSLVNGVFAAAVALAGMYGVTLLFNLPTSLKLVELSQPNQPLLQRLLREAPGTYQHSLQVANLSEQAANAVHANAELVRVSALYHDIGKMTNPAFFVENQADGVNPHDVLNDPYRSADIIISHVADGEKLARQYRLPSRLRDFIMEHHGTTLVSYFYRQALQQADGDEDAVDIEQFTYPGPKPQTRETAIMMLADSCESTVRARKPTNKQEIQDIVQQIIDARMRDGQLDECDLTANDIKTVRNIFVEMLQAVFHPRINYPANQPGAALPAVQVDTSLPTLLEAAEVSTLERPRAEALQTADADHSRHLRPQSISKEMPAVRIVMDNDDEAPLAEVPPLRRTGMMPRPDFTEVDSADKADGTFKDNGTD